MRAQRFTNSRVDAWVADKFVAKIALEANPSAGLKLGDMLWVERNATRGGEGQQFVGAGHQQSVSGGSGRRQLRSDLPEIP